VTITVIDAFLADLTYILTVEPQPDTSIRAIVILNNFLQRDMRVQNRFSLSKQVVQMMNLGQFLSSDSSMGAYARNQS